MGLVGRMFRDHAQLQGLLFLEFGFERSWVSKMTIFEPLKTKQVQLNPSAVPVNTCLADFLSFFRNMGYP